MVTPLMDNPRACSRSTAWFAHSGLDADRRAWVTHKRVRNQRLSAGTFVPTWVAIERATATCRDARRARGPQPAHGHDDVELPGGAE